MSTSPVTVAPVATRGEALALMRARKIHHMPVCDAGKVVGLVTDGDLADTGAEVQLKVKDLMRLHPFTVTPEQPVADVVKQMATHQYGSAAVVVDNGRVVGMFTATDGLRAFADHLRLGALGVR